MRRPRLSIVLTTALALTTAVWVLPAQAAGRPSVAAAVEGRESGTGRAIVTLVGKNLAKVSAAVVLDDDQMEVGAAEIVGKTGTQVVFRLPDGLPAGSYTLAVTAGKGEPIPVAIRAAGPALLTDGSNSMTGALRSTSNDGVLFGGTKDVGADPPTGPGARMFWYPKKYAFRAGMAVGDEWDPENIDEATIAIGRDCRTRYYGSTAIGTTAFASDAGAVAIGSFVTANSFATVALGAACNVNGGGIGIGRFVDATGPSSIAIGANVVATGDNAATLGVDTIAQSFGSFVCGTGNVPAGTPDSAVATDPLFVCGNGTADARSNALTLLRNGNLTITGTLTQNSDARLKTDVAPLTDVAARIAKLRGVSYAFADTTKHPAGRHIGLLAQDVREAFPELVTEGPDGTLSVAYGNLAAVLVEAVKEQSAEIAALRKEHEAEIAAVRKEQMDLVERLAQIESALAK